MGQAAWLMVHTGREGKGRGDTKGELWGSPGWGHGTETTGGVLTLSHSHLSTLVLVISMLVEGQGGLKPALPPHQGSLGPTTAGETQQAQGDPKGRKQQGWPSSGQPLPGEGPAAWLDSTPERSWAKQGPPSGPARCSPAPPRPTQANSTDPKVKTGGVRPA